MMLFFVFDGPASSRSSGLSPIRHQGFGGNADTSRTRRGHIADRSVDRRIKSMVREVSVLCPRRVRVPNHVMPANATTQTEDQEKKKGCPPERGTPSH